jgi:hypothetical protein
VGLGSVNDWAGGGISNCNITGPSAGTAIQTGYSSHASIGSLIENNSISGFALAISIGNGNAWGARVSHNIFFNNTQELNENASTGVAIGKFDHNNFTGSQQACSLNFGGSGGGDFEFDSDFFGDEQICLSSANTSFQVSFINSDFENTVNTTNKYVIQSTGFSRFDGLNLFQQVKASGAFPTSFITLSGGTMQMRGMWATSSQTMTSLVAISGSANLDMEITANLAATNDFSGTTTGALTRTTGSADFFRHFFSATLDFNEIGAQAVSASGQDRCYGDNSAHGIKCSYNAGAMMGLPLIPNFGGATMTTAAIAAGSCGTTVTVAAPNVTTGDSIEWAFNAAPAANPAQLVVSAWPTSGNVNFQYCNSSAGSITPNAATLNWRVVR